MSHRSFSRRIFVDSPIRSDDVEISGASAHHMINVIRTAPGDDVILFDGSGFEFPAKITRVGRTSLMANIIATTKISREISTCIVLAVALPKGDRKKVLVEKLVEVGVSRLIPINAIRSVAKADTKSSQRLIRQVIEASKQCGRNTLMEIAEPKSTREFFAKPDHSTKNMIAHPMGESSNASQLARESQIHTSITVAIGPEGGFEQSELDAAIASGWQPINLGPTILRVETAAVVLATLFGIGRE